ncbi:hypothetical protein D3C81_2090430 [compost metagenome]
MISGAPSIARLNWSSLSARSLSSDTSTTIMIPRPTAAGSTTDTSAVTTLDSRSRFMRRRQDTGDRFTRSATSWLVRWLSSCRLCRI